MNATVLRRYIPWYDVDIFHQLRLLDTPSTDVSTNDALKSSEPRNSWSQSPIARLTFMCSASESHPTSEFSDQLADACRPISLICVATSIALCKQSPLGFCGVARRRTAAGAISPYRISV